MKIYSTCGVKNIDTLTIRRGISSLELINRAADSVVCCIQVLGFKPKRIVICVGFGNNGADALAIASKLISRGYRVTILELDIDNVNRTDDNRLLYEALCAVNIDILHFTTDAVVLDTLKSEDLIVDGLLGNGVNRVIGGPLKTLIKRINRSDAQVISIDVPSGLIADEVTQGICVHADLTVVFQFPRLSFMFRETARCLGRWQVADIGLDQAAIAAEDSNWTYVDQHEIYTCWKVRDAHSHKGTFGHGYIAAGDVMMIGAARLAGLACLTTGAGRCGIVLSSINEVRTWSKPEIIHLTDDQVTNVKQGDTWCIGPGFGIDEIAKKRFKRLMAKISQPCVLDADALTLIAAEESLWYIIPENSVLTPHTKELERLLGPCDHDLDRMRRGIELAIKHQIVLVIKGHHTLTVSPLGDCYFNSTGNPGMATGGSGDVLAGIITGLICQGYSPLDSAIIGVYIHGFAGDIVADELSQEGLIASDIISHLPKAIKSINTKNRR